MLQALGRYFLFLMQHAIVAAILSLSFLWNILASITPFRIEKSLPIYLSLFTYVLPILVIICPIIYFAVDFYFSRAKAYVLTICIALASTVLLMSSLPNTQPISIPARPKQIQVPIQNTNYPHTFTEDSALYPSGTNMSYLYRNGVLQGGYLKGDPPAFYATEVFGSNGTYTLTSEWILTQDITIQLPTEPHVLRWLRGYWDTAAPLYQKLRPFRDSHPIYLGLCMFAFFLCLEIFAILLLNHHDFELASGFLGLLFGAAAALELPRICLWILSRPTWNTNLILPSAVTVTTLVALVVACEFVDIYGPWYIKRSVTKQADASE